MLTFFGKWFKSIIQGPNSPAYIGNIHSTEVRCTLGICKSFVAVRSMLGLENRAKDRAAVTLKFHCPRVMSCFHDIKGDYSE